MVSCMVVGCPSWLHMKVDKVLKHQIPNTKDLATCEARHVSCRIARIQKVYLQDVEKYKICCKRFPSDASNFSYAFYSWNMVVVWANLPGVPSTITCLKIVMNMGNTTVLKNYVSFTLVQDHLLLFLICAIPIGCSLCTQGMTTGTEVSDSCWKRLRPRKSNAVTKRRPSEQCLLWLEGLALT